MINYLARARTVTAALALGAAAAMALAAPVHADQYDFVSMLDNEGVYYSSISDVIDQGKMACRILRSGAGVPTALGYVADGGYAPYETAVVVAAAALNMCPDVASVVRAFFTAGPAAGI